MHQYLPISVIHQVKRIRKKMQDHLNRCRKKTDLMKFNTHYHKGSQQMRGGNFLNLVKGIYRKPTFKSYLMVKDSLPLTWHWEQGIKSTFTILSYIVNRILESTVK